MRNKIVGTLLSIAIVGVNFANQASAWSVKVGQQSALKVSDVYLKIDRPLAAKLSAADEAAFLPAEITLDDGGRVKWLVLRTASRSRHGAGFCGSGHEDRLILLQVRNGKVASAGEFTAQSCLSSISMDIDQLHELTEALHQNPKTGDLTFQQSVSSDIGSFRRVVKIMVGGGKVKIETQNLNTPE